MSDVIDFGSTGAAQLERKSVIFDIAGRSTGSVTPGEVILARLMLVECELDRLLVRCKITDAQWRGGILFRRDWLFVVKSPKVTTMYVDPRSQVGARDGGSTEVESVSARRVEARARINAILTRLTMPQWGAVLAVAGQDEPNAEGCESRLRWLREACDDLVVFYEVPEGYRRFRGR